jgi:glucosamine--fructose-6-phosphate aminotransferase (isomerizing)
VTGAVASPLAELADEVVVCTPEIERSWCHTASYTCAVAAIAVMSGKDIAWLAEAVEAVLGHGLAWPTSHGVTWPIGRLQGPILVAGAGHAWPTAQEAVLKLREGAHALAGAHHTEQLLHGALAAVDDSVRAYVLEGEGRAAERAADAVRALEAIGCDTTLVRTRHPVVDIVPFQLLTLALADERGINPDAIRREPGSPWAAAAGSAYPRA